jgi:hypothetical protein
MTVFWDVAPCILVEIVRRFYETTWRNITEGSHLHIRRRENVKSELGDFLFLRDFLQWV